MSDSETNARSGIEASPADILACVGACTALGVAFVDLLLALLVEPGRQHGFISLLPPLGLLAAASSIAFAVLYGVIGAIWPDTQKNQTLTRSFALGAFLIAFFSLIWIANLNSFTTLQRAPWASLLQLTLLFLLATLAGAGARSLALQAARKSSSTLTLLRGTTLSTILLLSLALGIGLWQSQRSLILMALVIGAAALITLTFRLHFIGLGRLPLLILAAFLASPLLTVLAWTQTAASSSLAAEAPVRRIILLTVDTLRRDSLSLYNPDSTTQTPELDRLGEDSLIFENAFSSAPWTVPAFASLFTGLTPDAHGINDNFPEVPREMKLIAQSLQEKGYLTAAIGNQIQLRRMNRGFDHFKIGPEKSPFHPRTTFGRLLGRRWSPSQWTSQRISNLSRQWLNENRDEDFFLWVHWIEPHISYAPPSEYVTDADLLEEWGPRFDGHLHSSVRAGRVIRTESEKRWLRELYDAEVRYTDDVVGQVLDRLRALDLYDDSLIIFTSDHGEEFWDHGGWEHGHSVYDEVVAAPLLIKLPGESRSQRIRTPVSTSALTETLLDLSQAPRDPDPLRTPSLAPLWTTPDQAPAPPTVYIAGIEYFEPQEAVVFDHYKYIARPDSGREELYDLTADPGENNSLAETHPEILQRGRDLLAAHRAKVSRLGSTSTNSTESPGEMSPEVEAQLRALGYID